MLQAIRDRSQSVFAFVIVIIMIIPFALWGVQEYLGGGGLLNVAKVNGQPITTDDFGRSYSNYREQQRQRLAQIFQNNLNNPLYKQLMDETAMKQTVLDGMIESELLTQAAYDEGFRVSTAQIDNQIRAIPSFQTDGQFDPVVYKRQIGYQGLSSQGFKSLLESDLVTEQMLRGLSLTSIVTSHDISEKLRIQNQKRDMGYALIPAARFKQTVTVSDEDIRAMYDKNASQYQTPERIIISYIEISVDDMAQALTVTEEQLRQYYQDHDVAYQVDELAVQANAILKRVRAGESFAELAKEFSKDPGSAANGGDLGYFGRNVMDKAFEDTVFSMKPGEISGPVRTSFGYHIIKLTDIKDDQRKASHILIAKDSDDKSVGRIKPFEEVRAQVEKDYRRKTAEDQFADIYDQLNNLTYENPQTLEVAADELQLKIKTSESFGREGGLGILSNPKIVDAAFSEDVLELGNNSQLIELSDTQVFVLRKKEYRKPQRRPLEEVKTLIGEQVRNQKATEEAKRVGEEILSRIVKGESFDTLAKEYSFDWKKPGPLSRTNKEIDAVLTQSLFKMPRPTDSKPVYNGLGMRSGDYAIIGLFAVAEGDITKQDETEKSKARAELLKIKRDSELAAYKAQLKTDAEIEIFKENL